MNSDKTNTLSFYNDHGILTLQAKQYDTGRRFIFHIMDNDEPVILENSRIYLRMQKADGTQFQGEECCIISGDTVTVDTSVGNGNQILTCVGKNQCELHLTDGSGASLTTWNFILNVAPRVHDGTHIDSVDSWDSWDNMKDAVDNITDKIESHFFVLTTDKSVSGGVPSLDENIKIPVSELYEATTTQKGITQLTDSVESTSITTAATPNSVKTVYDALTQETDRAKDAEKAIKAQITTSKPVWDDKYTKNEIDNKFSALESNIDWKETVSTYDDIAGAYPDPQDGWTVNVKDTDYTYRYNGTSWVAISANALPKATRDVDGLLSKEGYQKLQDLTEMSYEDTLAVLNAHKPDTETR